LLFRACVVLGLSASAAYRVPAPRMGLFDGVKDAFGAKQGDSDKPLVAADRVTPFDRWLGLDKELVAANAPDKTASYVDPTSVTNYFSSSLTKPMGIAFVENENACGGVYVEDVLAEGSASSAGTIQKGDQLVAVDATLVLGVDFDAALDAIKDSSADTTKLTFFRGPTAFLYGPTAPAPAWYQENLLS